MSAEKFGRYKAEIEARTGRKERLALGNMVESEKKTSIVEIYGGLREGIRTKMYLHGPMDFAETLKLRCLCRWPGPARKRKEASQQPGGGGSRLTYVPVWQSDRE